MDNQVPMNHVANELNKRATFNSAYTFTMMVAITAMMYMQMTVYFWIIAFLLLGVNIIYLYLQLNYKVYLLKKYDLHISPLDWILNRIYK